MLPSRLPSPVSRHACHPCTASHLDKYQRHGFGLGLAQMTSVARCMPVAQHSGRGYKRRRPAAPRAAAAAGGGEHSGEEDEETETDDDDDEAKVGHVHKPALRSPAPCTAQLPNTPAARPRAPASFSRQAHGPPWAPRRRIRTCNHGKTTISSCFTHDPVTRAGSPPCGQPTMLLTHSAANPQCCPPTAHRSCARWRRAPAAVRASPGPSPRRRPPPDRRSHPSRRACGP